MIRILRTSLRTAQLAPKLVPQLVVQYSPFTARAGLHTSLARRGNADPIVKEDMSEIKLEPAPRPNEPTEQKRARLLYQSRKRGILETCVILGKFAKDVLPSLTREELDDYDILMNENDWDIYYWITETPECPTPCPERWEKSSIMSKLRKVGRNEERDIMRLPDLD